MKKNRLIVRTVILVVLIVAVGYTIYANFIASNELVKVGSAAPDFVLTDLNGNEVQLSDYRGKGVFLNFWGTWCEPCEREMPYMENQYKIFKDQGVKIIAVEAGSTKLAVENFRDKYGLTFPIVIDKGGKVVQAYDIYNLPDTYLIDKNGVVLDKITGEMTEADVKRYMERIKP